MAGLVCLTIAVICAVISRVLLLMAALDISIWWALGVFFPFGPLLFRLSYPDAARSSYFFRVGTLACIFLYFVVVSGPLMGRPHRSAASQSQSGKGYAMEFISKIFRRTPIKTKGPSLDERRTANEREFGRLNQWSDALRARKRDLLSSDVEGNHAYNIDLEEYQAALADATAEKQVLAKVSGPK
jgi:hypothetical protein